MVRAAVYYAASTFVLALFGCEVCPYIHTLGEPTFGVLLGACFTVAIAVRRPLERRLVDAAVPLERARAQFRLDFGLYLSVGVAVTAYDRLAYGFPVGSGLRAIAGLATAGLFCGLDAALSRERSVLTELTRSESSILTHDRFFSLTRKFGLIAVSLLTLVTVDLLMLAIRDVSGIANAGNVPGATREIVIEGAVALGFLFALTTNLIASYARNLGLFLDSQRRVLDEVASGRLDVAVPVASSDEFAQIARQTNRMIDGLRDRERVRSLFGKLVSPAIADRLLTAKDGLKLGGSRLNVVVVFSDIRGFTTRTESADPEALVADLNTYLTRMVDIVHSHGGVVDKFIGDGMMAIFGLEEYAGAADQAARAALAMHVGVAELNPALREPFAIGVGVHAGEVVAGTVGSPERLEFTFIGDAVNTAARIEGLTKNLQMPLLVSAKVHEALSGAAASWPWVAVGEHELKGKVDRLSLFGLGQDSIMATRPGV